MKGTIREGASAEDMHAHMQSLGATQTGAGAEFDDATCSQRGWIINGCYWCGTDNCVNPGWLMATCCHCGKAYFVNRN